MGIAADGVDLYIAASRLGSNLAADNSGLMLPPPLGASRSGDVSDLDAAGFAFHFYRIRGTRYGNFKVAAETLRLATSPIGDDPSRIATDIGADFVGLELMPRGILRSIGTIVHSVSDVAFIAAIDSNGTEIGFHPYIFCGSDGARNFLEPRTALLVDIRLLRASQRYQHQQTAASLDSS